MIYLGVGTIVYDQDTILVSKLFERGAWGFKLILFLAIDLPMCILIAFYDHS